MTEQIPDTGRLPRHVAFIMDGNGRWAEERGQPRVLGHRAGAETVRRVTTFARTAGIPYLTLYAFSTENWDRPQEEVDALMLLLGEFVDLELPNLLEKNIRFRVIGDPGRLSEALRSKLRQAEAATAAKDALTLTLGINYGGRDEIARAAAKAWRLLADKDLGPESLDATTLAACLDTAGMPDPDVVVRTAGEMRLSNFLIWQAAYAEFVFTPRRWPEFSDQDFTEVLEEYGRRVRTFGT